MLPFVNCDGPVEPRSLVESLHLFDKCTFGQMVRHHLRRIASVEMKILLMRGLCKIIWAGRRTDKYSLWTRCRTSYNYTPPPPPGTHPWHLSSIILINWVYPTARNLQCYYHSINWANQTLIIPYMSASSLKITPFRAILNMLLHIFVVYLCVLCGRPPFLRCIWAHEYSTFWLGLVCATRWNTLKEGALFSHPNISSNVLCMRMQNQIFIKHWLIFQIV